MKNVKRSPFSNDRRKAKIIEFLFLLAIVSYQIINFCIFNLGTNVSTVLLTFQDIDKKTGVVSWIGFQNYLDVFRSFASGGSDYLNALKGSFLHYGSSLLTFPVGLFMAFYVYKKAFGTKAFRFIVMIPNILSGMIVGLMFKRFMYALPMLMKQVGFENFPALMSDPDWTFFTTIYRGERYRRNSVF